MSGKVDLLLEPSGGWWSYACGPRPRPVRRMLPWYAAKMRATNGLAYCHRVRSASLFLSYDGEARVCVRLFCGQAGSGRRGDVYAEPPGHTVVCATCEARAVGAGFPALAITAHRPISFRPRHTYQREWSWRP